MYLWFMDKNLLFWEEWHRFVDSLMIDPSSCHLQQENGALPGSCGQGAVARTLSGIISLVGCFCCFYYCCCMGGGVLPPPWLLLCLLLWGLLLGTGHLPFPAAETLWPACFPLWSEPLVDPPSPLGHVPLSLFFPRGWDSLLNCFLPYWTLNIIL